MDLPAFGRRYSTTLAIVGMTVVLIFIYAQQNEQTDRLENLAGFNACQSLEVQVENEAHFRVAFFAQRDQLRTDLEDITPPLTFRAIEEALGRIQAPPPPDPQLVERRDRICDEALAKEDR
jgi:hypothetical protein